MLLTTSLPGLFIVCMCLSEIYADHFCLDEAYDDESIVVASLLLRMWAVWRRNHSLETTHSFLCDHLGPDIFPRAARHS